MDLLFRFNTTFNNISVISWWPVLFVEETGCICCYKELRVNEQKVNMCVKHQHVCCYLVYHCITTYPIKHQSQCSVPCLGKILTCDIE